MKKLILIAGMLSATFTGFCQTTFNKRYDTDLNIDGLPTGIVEGNLNYYMLDVYGNVTKIDNTGVAVWNNQTPLPQDGSIISNGANICVLGDGNLLVAGDLTYPNYNGRTCWSKIDVSGLPVHVNDKLATNFPNTLDFYHLDVYDVSPTSDGGAILCGLNLYSNVTTSPNRPGFIKVDGNGNYIWAKSFIAVPLEGYSPAQVIEETQDGEFIIGGWAGAAIPTVAGHAGWIIKADMIGGTTSWYVNFYRSYNNQPGLYAVEITDVLELSNGNFAVIGNQNIDQQGFLFLLGPQGNIIGHYFYTYPNDATKNIRFNSIIEKPNKNLAIIGANYDNPLNNYIAEDLVMLTVSSVDGEVLEAKKYVGVCNQTTYSLNNTILTSDNGILTTLFSDVPASTNLTPKALIKTDLNGAGTDICPIELVVKKNNHTEFIYEIFDGIPILQNEYFLQEDFSTLPVQVLENFDNPCCIIPLTLGDFNVDCTKPYFLEAPSGAFVSYYWSTGEVTSSIEISPGNSYTLTVVDANGCIGTATYDFDLPLFDDFAITGPEKKCCGLQEFSLPGGGVFSGLQWSIVPASAGTIVSQGLPTTQIIWNDLSNDATVVLFVENGDQGCDATFEYVVKGCCPDLVAVPQIRVSTDFCNPTLLSTLTSAGLLSNTGTETTSLYILLNHDLIIDQDYTFLNCPNILIEGDHKIIIQPGIDLTINRCTLKAKCNKMWDGIYVSDVNSILTIQSTSNLEQAKNAVVSENGGIFTISNTNFSNNHICIKVDPYSGTHLGTVISSVFSSVTGALLSPYNGSNIRMFKGVEINEVNQITIGNFALAGQQNKFDNMDYGIWSYLSNVNVYNNKFDNMSTTQNQNCITCPCQAGTAICASSLKGFYRTLNVGGTGLRQNKFMKNQYGIWCNRFMHLNADNNDIRQTVRTAIRNENSPTANINITNNIVNRFNIGTEILDCGQNSNTFISQNTYNTSVPSFFGPFINNTAILIQNSFSSSHELEISYNNIQKVNNGIFLRQVDNFNISPGSSSDIFENDIKFGVVNNLTSSFFYGIRLESSSGLSITNNHIFKTNNTNPILAVVDNLRGVSLNMSANNTVANNTIDKMGAGIRAAGNCYPSTIECNELNQNYFGVEGEMFANIGDQVQGPKPTGNIWNGSIGYDLDLSSMSGFMSWYHSGTPPTQSPATTNFLNTGTSIFVTNPDNCSNYPVMQLIQLREEKLGAIVRNEKNYNSLSDEFKLHDKKFAYKFLHENPGFLNLGSSDDSIYANFFNQNNITSAGKFNQINGKFELEETNTAEFLNNSIITINNWDGNMKFFNEKYISKLSSGSLSSSDSTELWDLAWLNAINAGPGVISARAILKLDIEDLPNGETRKTEYFESENDAESETFIEIMPNPSTGLFNCRIDSPSVCIIYNILDINGRIIFTEKCISNKFLIDLSKYDSGIYIIEIITEVTISKAKLVKQ